MRSVNVTARTGGDIDVLTFLQNSMYKTRLKYLMRYSNFSIKKKNCGEIIFILPKHIKLILQKTDSWKKMTTYVINKMVKDKGAMTWDKHTVPFYGDASFLLNGKS